MKKFAMWGMVVLILFSLIGCGSKQNETINEYKREARYFYEQVDLILNNLNVIEEADNSISNIEDGFFASTLQRTLFRSVCLENLISINQYYNGLEISTVEMENLYADVSSDDEINNIKEVVNALDSECDSLKNLLKNATEYNSDFTDKYNASIGNIMAQAELLYNYVGNVESAIHNMENGTDNEYQDELDEIEQIMLEENDTEAVLQERDANNPVLVGECVNIKFLDFLYNKKADGSPCIVECNITFKSYDKDTGVVCLNFEIVSSETSEAVHVDDRMSSLVYALVDENMTRNFVGYDGVYREDTGSTLISVYEKGNVDCYINVSSNNFLQIVYSPPTEDNISGKNQFYSENTLWFELK